MKTLTEATEIPVVSAFVQEDEVQEGDLIVTGRSVHYVRSINEGEILITTYRMSSTWAKDIEEFNKWRATWKNAKIFRTK